MRDLCLQEWLTIRGTDTTLTVIQGSSDWLDVGDFEDFTIFLDVREMTAGGLTPRMAYETAPSKNDAAFKAMLPAFPIATGVRVDRVTTAYAAVPPARWFRWKLLHGGTLWDVTFRIRLAAYAWVKS
jgi:hypothetical protein